MNQEKKKNNSYNHEVKRLLAPYKAVLPLVSGKRVLDLGCGRGRGSSVLADYAEKVVAIDISADTISENKRRYVNKGNLVFKEMNAEKLELEDNNFDVVISFEVIEHVDNPDIFLREIKRVLKSSGFAFLTTPNRKVRLLPLQKPWNPEHKREYYLKEFRKELESVFSNTTILGIFGRGNLHDLFLKKQKQNILGVYGTMIFTPRLAGFVKFLLGKEKKKYIQGKNQGTQEKSFGKLDDKQSLIVIKENLKSCLNFFAICTLDKNINIRKIKKILFN